MVDTLGGAPLGEGGGAGVAISYVEDGVGKAVNDSGVHKDVYCEVVGHMSEGLLQVLGI